MPYFVVIDTNVLVSAMLKWDSVPGTLMQLVFSGRAIPLLCEQIISEYLEVLARPKFHFNDEVIHDVMEAIKMQGVYLNPEAAKEELPDPKDKIFYEVVLEKRKTCDAYLVTGNMKHFPARTYILTPREMIEILFAS
jgi:putative PIN family toxin of toxin-antitoxin system